MVKFEWKFELVGMGIEIILGALMHRFPQNELWFWLSIGVGVLILFYPVIIWIFKLSKTIKKKKPYIIWEPIFLGLCILLIGTIWLIKIYPSQKKAEELSTPASVSTAVTVQIPVTVSVINKTNNSTNALISTNNQSGGNNSVSINNSLNLNYSTTQHNLTWLERMKEKEDDLTSFLKRHSSYKVKIVLMAPMGDGNAYLCAVEFKKILTDAGWKVVGINTFMGTQPVFGLQMNVDENRTSDVTAAAEALQSCFSFIKLKATGYLDKNVGNDEVLLFFGNENVNE